MNCQNLVFSRHAIQQMFLRQISKQEVIRVIAYGEVIEEKPDDTPFPSYLILDFVDGQPIHVVFSYDEVNDTGYVVTAYIPNPNLWTDNFRKRK
ncbi:DUF4258 domain-containing protein [Brasilonema sennae CENA114]|uniref:DUF4258 domain-containing protein n=1 Tax=Brasilonema sennae CENA114 TaxID=415709 RepID=A0A856MQV7_9CYAN|nr:DUF4258 domain-containing protein [Brasilonema sennae]QDL12530.1 DUF4258 domain-containing protein [Brasilonema sennae CENA114]